MHWKKTKFKKSAKLHFKISIVGGQNISLFLHETKTLKEEKVRQIPFYTRHQSKKQLYEWIPYVDTLSKTKLNSVQMCRKWDTQKNHEIALCLFLLLRRRKRNLLKKKKPNKFSKNVQRLLYMW